MAKSFVRLLTPLGIDKDGLKDVLGIYIGENESSTFWLSVLTDLQNRGVKDILIACVDGLKGFPEAIASIFPKTEVQTTSPPNEKGDKKSIYFPDRRFAFQTALPGCEGRNSKMDDSKVELGAGHCAALNPF